MSGDSGEQYTAKFNGNLWESVFPSHQADLSDTHLSPEEAVQYIKGKVGENVHVEVVPPN